MTSSASHLSTDYIRFRRRLILGSLAVALLAGLVSGWRIHASDTERQHGAEAQTQALAHAVAAHVTDSIHLVDHALIGFTQEFKDHAGAPAHSTALIERLLAERSLAGDDAFWLMFIDARGNGVASSGKVAVRGVSYADRDYFRALAGTGAGPGLHIGAPLMARVSGRRILPLSRRVVGARDEFLGVVVGLLDAGRLAAMFDNARFNGDVMVALAHRDGKLVARVPRFEQSFATSVLDTAPFIRLREGRPQTFRAESRIDAVVKLYSSRPLAPYPLDVVAAISIDALNAALWNDVAWGALRLAALSALLLLGARFALRSYRDLAAARQALRESEFRWRFALEGSGASVWDWNLETGALRLSPRWKQMLGYADNQAESDHGDWCRHVHPDDQSRAEAERMALVKGATAQYVNEHRVHCRDGGWKWILSRGMVLSRDAAGRALRVIGVHADITERKQAEQAQVRRVIEAAPDPMLLVGADQGIAFANAAAQAAFGYSLEQLIGMDLRRRLPSAPGADPEPGPAAAHQRHAVRADGSEFPAEVSLSPFQMNGQDVVIVHLRDLSESHRAAHMLEQSLLRLRQLSDHQEQIKEAERKRIAQDIHDDLGQNLLALKLDVAMLHERTERSHPRLHERVGIVLDNINATIRSVRTIMNDLRPAMLELGLHPAVVWQLRQYERVSGIRCVLTTEQTEFGLEESQTLAVFRILQESLANVARHAQASEVRVALNGYPGGFFMAVSDNGKGLLARDRGKRDSFGLMGIRERTHSLRGELTITSSPGGGTVVSISIPVRKFNPPA